MSSMITISAIPDLVSTKCSPTNNGLTSGSSIPSENFSHQIKSSGHSRSVLNSISSSSPGNPLPSTALPISAAESLPALPSTYHDSPVSGLILVLKHLLEAYLSSRLHKFVVIVLVLLDVLKSLAGLGVNLDHVDYPGTPVMGFLCNVFEILGLVFSHVFVIELIISIWTFGFRYFLVPGHIVDGIVIGINYAISIFLQGAVEQYASLVVLIRLWRIFAKVRPTVVDPATLRLLHDPSV